MKLKITFLDYAKHQTHEITFHVNSAQEFEDYILGCTGLTTLEEFDQIFSITKVRPKQYEESLNVESIMSLYKDIQNIFEYLPEEIYPYLDELFIDHTLDDLLNCEIVVENKRLIDVAHDMIDTYNIPNEVKCCINYEQFADNLRKEQDVIELQDTTIFIY